MATASKRDSAQLKASITRLADFVKKEQHSQENKAKAEAVIRAKVIALYQLERDRYKDKKTQAEDNSWLELWSSTTKSASPLSMSPSIPSSKPNGLQEDIQNFNSDLEQLLSQIEAGGTVEKTNEAELETSQVDPHFEFSDEIFSSKK